MKIKKIILEKWIDPALITHHLTKKFGDKGLAWLDSDGKENGEWSITVSYTHLTLPTTPYV